MERASVDRAALPPPPSAGSPLLVLNQITAGLIYTDWYWSAGQFTFSIPTASSSWSGYGGGAEPFVGFRAFTPQQAGRFRDAVALWDSYIAPDFTETNDQTSPGNIRAAFSGHAALNSPWGYAYVPPSGGGTPSALNGDIWIDDDNAGSSFASGTFDWEALLHELGHALGLKHSFEAPALPGAFDNRRYTLMAYEDIAETHLTFFRNASGGVSASTARIDPSTPMVLDIAAAQARYGVDPDTARGDDTYRFVEGEVLMRAINDAGGIDTLDLSNFTRSSSVDLSPGAYSSIGYFSAADQKAYWQQQFPGWNLQATFDSVTLYTWSNNLGIAFSTLIENANGGSGDDRLLGNFANNRLVGGGGDDALYGLDGDDLIGGQDGNDFISGGRGRDDLYGDAGADSINGDADADRLFGQGGDDLIGGQDGDDSIDGGAGRDRLFGDSGNDLIVGGSDNDELRGGDGDDLIGGQDGDDFVEGGAGRDDLYGDAGRDVVVGGTDNDRLFGQDGDDLIGGQDGDDFVDGGAGRDDLYGDAGRDLILGGSDNDRLFGQDGDDLIGGQDGDDFVDGGAGRDDLYGDAGRDLIVGGGDDDRLFGQDGDDLIGGQDGNDFVDGGAGRDELYGDAGADLVIGGGDNDRLFGGDGDDRMGGQDGDDFLSGGSGRDQLFGDAGADRLHGDAEGDELRGGDGDDIMGGQDGDDLLVGEAGNDQLYGDAGFDTAVFRGARAGYSITSSNGVITVSGADGTDTLFGVERLQFDDGVFAAGPLADPGEAFEAAVDEGNAVAPRPEIHVSPAEVEFVL